MIGSIIEARNVLKRLPAGAQKNLGILFGNFLKGLEAVGGESGADHVDTQRAVFR